MVRAYFGAKEMKLSGSPITHPDVLAPQHGRGGPSSRVNSFCLLLPLLLPQAALWACRVTLLHVAHCSACHIETHCVLGPVSTKSVLRKSSSEKYACRSIDHLISDIALSNKRSGRTCSVSTDCYNENNLRRRNGQRAGGSIERSMGQICKSSISNQHIYCLHHERGLQLQDCEDH